MDDEEIGELILSRLRQRRAQQAADRTASAADLATFFNEPEPRIQNRLRALADQGLIKESAAAPDRWMISSPAAPATTTEPAANRLAFLFPRVEGWQSG